MCACCKHVDCHKTVHIAFWKCFFLSQKDVIFTVVAMETRSEGVGGGKNDHHHGVSMCLWTAETEVIVPFPVSFPGSFKWEWKFIRTEYISPLPKTTIEATVSLYTNMAAVFHLPSHSQWPFAYSVVMVFFMLFFPPTYTLTSCLHGNHSENNVLLLNENHFQNATWTVLLQSPVNMHRTVFGQNWLSWHCIV